MESGKTVSRKARSRPESNRGSAAHSPVTSPASSRANSRAGSRYASEDDGATDSEYDDGMTASTNSASDDALDGDTRDPWVDRLQSRISELEDRKRSSVSGRVNTLRAYLHLLRHHFAQSQIDGSVAEIVDALLRCIRSGGSAEERSLALRSLAVTTLTSDSEAIYEPVFPTLKVVCEDDEDETVKVDAIHAMTIAVLYGGGSLAAAEGMLEFLTRIIESDGEIVAALDSSLVVTAALQAWGFVATHVDDLGDQCEDAMEAFVGQLESSNAEVQSGAGSNIALLFEAAREHEEEMGETLNLRYDPKELVRRMNGLARGSKSISKKDRRQVRTSLSSVVTSLELGKGPAYSTAGRPTSNPHTGGSKVESDSDVQEFGYREKIRVNNSIMVIDSWSLMVRVELLKHLLAGGFPTHFTDNPTVADILSSAEVEQLPVAGRAPKTPEKKGRKSARTGWD